MFETHIHNDYVSGGLALARATGAAYHVNAADEVAFDRIGVTDGGAIEVADSMRVRVIATPGHTFTHLSCALEHTTTGRVAAVFTGGSLLHGSTGRPDLLGPAHKVTLAAAQHASAPAAGPARACAVPRDAPVGSAPTPRVRQLLSLLPSPVAPSPGAAPPRSARRMVNPVLTQDEDSVVAELLAGLDAYPAYTRAAGRRPAGPGPADLSAAPAPAPDAAQAQPPAIAAGEWVADLRSRQLRPGSGTRVQHGGDFTNYLGRA